MSQPQMGTTAAADADGDRWISAQVGASGFRAELHARGHVFAADEPLSLGGSDAGPTPYELLLGALSGCTAMTLRMYADRKGYPLESVVVQMRTARSHEPDCENCATQKVGITRVERRIEMGGPISDEQRERLLQVADRCPVKQTLERGFQIESVA
jgi:uncharacterized OsmC-like protein